jgi:hypothetical protein
MPVVHTKVFDEGEFVEGKATVYPNISAMKKRLHS